jgi:hypothetical protein
MHVTNSVSNVFNEFAHVRVPYRSIFSCLVAAWNPSKLEAVWNISKQPEFLLRVLGTMSILLSADCQRLFLQYIGSYPPYSQVVSSVRILRMRHAMATREPIDIDLFDTKTSSYYWSTRGSKTLRTVKYTSSFTRSKLPLRESHFRLVLYSSSARIPTFLTETIHVSSQSIWTSAWREGALP